MGRAGCSRRALCLYTASPSLYCSATKCGTTLMRTCRSGSLPATFFWQADHLLEGLGAGKDAVGANAEEMFQ